MKSAFLYRTASLRQASWRQFLPATPASWYNYPCSGLCHQPLEIKEKVESIYGEKALKKMASYAIIKKVKNGENTDDQRHLKVKKNGHDPSSHCLCCGCH